MNYERRFYPVDNLAVRAEDSPPRLMGHAAVFNQDAELGWFRERIMPGAFVDSIAADDIRALFNHDPNFVLGRNKSGTLRLKEDEIGLAIENDPPDTQWARDLLTTIRRGDITQMSFGFEVIDQRWETKDGMELRIIARAKLWDVSPVTFAAYPQTDVAVRAHEAWRKQHQPAGTPLALADQILRINAAL